MVSEVCTHSPQQLRLSNRNDFISLIWLIVKVHSIWHSQNVYSVFVVFSRSCLPTSWPPLLTSSFLSPTYQSVFWPHKMNSKDCFHSVTLCFLECRTLERTRHGAGGEDFDYPPMDSGGFSPPPHPPPWLGPPPPYEVAIKTTCSSTQLRRAYSDTHLATEPLFARSREISFEVWWRMTGTPRLSVLQKQTDSTMAVLWRLQTQSNTWSMYFSDVDL